MHPDWPGATRNLEPALPASTSPTRRSHDRQPGRRRLHRPNVLRRRHPRNQPATQPRPTTTSSSPSTSHPAPTSPKAPGTHESATAQADHPRPRPRNRRRRPDPRPIAAPGGDIARPDHGVRPGRVLETQRSAAAPSRHDSSGNDHHLEATGAYDPPNWGQFAGPPRRPGRRLAAPATTGESSIDELPASHQQLHRSPSGSIRQATTPATGGGEIIGQGASYHGNPGWNIMGLGAGARRIQVRRVRRRQPARTPTTHTPKTPGTSSPSSATPAPGSCTSTACSKRPRSRTTPAASTYRNLARQRRRQPALDHRHPPPKLPCSPTRSSSTGALTGDRAPRHLRRHHHRRRQVADASTKTATSSGQPPGTSVEHGDGTRRPSPTKPGLPASYAGSPENAQRLALLRPLRIRRPLRQQPRPVRRTAPEMDTSAVQHRPHPAPLGTRRRRRLERRLAPRRPRPHRTRQKRDACSSPPEWRSRRRRLGVRLVLDRVPNGRLDASCPATAPSTAPTTTSAPPA